MTEPTAQQTLPEPPPVPKKIDPQLGIRIALTFLRRRWIPLLLAGLIAAAAAKFTADAMAERVWKSTCLMLYTPPPIPDKIKGMKSSLELANISGLMSSRPVAEQAISELGLKLSPSVLMSSVMVETSRSTSTVFASLKWGDKREAQQIIATISQVFPRYVAEVRRAIANQRLKENEKAVARTKSRLEAARMRYRDFSRKHKIRRPEARSLTGPDFHPIVGIKTGRSETRRAESDRSNQNAQRPYQ